MDYHAWCRAMQYHAMQCQFMAYQHAINHHYAELRAAEAEGVRIKEQHRIREEQAELNNDIDDVFKEGETARLAYAKEILQNEKIQELAQCRVYREDDKFERIVCEQQKRAEFRRDLRRMSRKARAEKKAADRAAAAEERRQLKNYTQEVFDKAQLSISLGQNQVFGERARYSIPRTKRPMGTSFGWNKPSQGKW